MEDIKTPLSLSDLLSMHDSAMTKFQNIWISAERNESRWMGESWTDRQKQEVAEQGRTPYSFLLVTSKLKTISGSFRDAKTSYRVLAKADPMDEVKAELATLKLRRVADASDMYNIENDIFDSGLAIKYGVAKVYLDEAKGYPRVKIKKLSYRDFIWDTNNIAYDINEDALWAAEAESLYRYQLKDLGIDTSHASEGTYQWEGREKQSYYVKQSYSGENDFDIIRVFNHYQKVSRLYYCVVFPDSRDLLGITNQMVAKFRSKEEAEYKLRELQAVYMINGLEKEGEIVEKIETRLDRYKFCYNAVLEYEETELEKFPYAVFFCYHFEGEFISMMDFLESHQLYIDRILAQIDYSLGTQLKDLKALNVAALADGETPESAIRKAQDGGIILKNNGMELFEQKTQPGINPQYLQLFSILKEMLEDQAGGRNFQGLSEGSNESGVAIQKKQAAGRLLAKDVMDNFSRFKKILGENILWWIKEFETMEDTIKVEGGALSEQMIAVLQQNGIYAQNPFKEGEGLVTINKEGSELSFLNDADLELTVSEANLTPAEKFEKMNMMILNEQQNPQLIQSPTWLRLKLENMDINAADRQKLIKEYDEIQNQQMQMAQQQMDIRKAEVLAGMQNQQAINMQRANKAKPKSDNRSNPDNQPQQEG